MKRLLISSLIASVVMFIWGALFWQSPLPYSATEMVSDQRQVLQQLEQTLPNSGTYVLPSVMVPDADMDAVMAMYEQGPIVIAQVSPGRPAFDPMIFVNGLLHYFAIAMILGLAMFKLLPNQLDSFSSKFALTVFAATVMVIFSHGSELIWWGIPKGWTLWTAFYEFSAILIGGAIMAKGVKSTDQGDIKSKT
ncbi:hypothetical protein [Thalassotalea sp. PS06]|uniref:hypothetical protein n=1 Tax=Thalassotalea sp. PS06 TaxID=2594005 RepID=UPI0011635E34|nr:hypothetical protein [Thalassotalea sp. PS06]QDP00601.1 hypothetical protein FNC98_04075 [Thalassotalea sp. PS06]